MLYPYEYFCGANVIVEVESMPLYEAAGISFSVNESKRPLYGYNARHFNAVGRGQVIVSGSMLINYIHQDYLMKSFEIGQQLNLNPSANPNPPSSNPLVSPNNIVTPNLFSAVESDVYSNLALEYVDNEASTIELVAGEFTNRYWPRPNNQTVLPGTSGPVNSAPYSNPHDLSRGLNIKITFGERSPFNGYNGVTGYLLSGVQFTSRSQAIQISEEVIVEEYSFFARNIHTINPDYVTMSGQFSESSIYSDETRIDVKTDGSNVTFGKFTDALLPYK